jgi:sulfide:quinone oxidoreductase
MGCRPDISDIPGLADDFNSFYTSMDDARKLGNKINNFDKGHIVISTVKMPIPCPGAPSKFAVLLDDYLRHVRKVRDNVEITFILPVSLIGPPQYNKQITKILEDKNVNIIREYKLSRVDANNKKLISADGSEIKYDLLITIPPHRSIKALIDSGITDKNGWIPADKNTLQYKKSESESYNEVYVVGDSGPMEILKTGIGAHYQALIAAQNLINDITGNKTRVLYRGETGCPFVESSYTTATRGVGYLPTWTYDKPLGEFTPTKLGWFAYRMYYYIYWDTSVKALM